MVANGSSLLPSSNGCGSSSSGISIPPGRNTSFWKKNQDDLASSSQKAMPPKAWLEAMLAAQASSTAGTDSASAAPDGGPPTNSEVSNVPAAKAAIRRAHD